MMIHITSRSLNGALIKIDTSNSRILHDCQDFRNQKHEGVFWKKSEMCEKGYIWTESQKCTGKESFQNDDMRKELIYTGY